MHTTTHADLPRALPAPADATGDDGTYRAILRAAVGLRTQALADGAVPPLLRLCVDAEAYDVIVRMQRAHLAASGRTLAPNGVVTLLAMPVERDDRLTRELVVRYPAPDASPLPPRSLPGRPGVYPSRAECFVHASRVVPSEAVA